MAESRERELGTHGESCMEGPPIHAILRHQAAAIAERPREVDRIGIGIAMEAVVRRHIERASSGARATRSVFRAWWRCQRTVPRGRSSISPISVLDLPSMSESSTMRR